MNFKYASYIFFSIIETLLRFFPVPVKIGLVKIGHPNENSPVFLTVNYHLTVLRVKKTLKGIDCYLLIANSKGINVWCAAAGGHFNNHSVISILKTSGIEELVSHKKVILPQLAAVGIERKVILEKTGWNIIWGPVYAKDIYAFLENNFRKEDYMRKVSFSFVERLEMAIMWSFTFSLFLLIPTLIFWINEILFSLIIIWLPAILLFVLFPLYEPFLKKENIKEKSLSTVFFKILLVSFSWMFTMIPVLLAYLYTTHTWIFFLRWGVISFVVILSITLDLKGSTPVYKSDIIEENKFSVQLDKEKCLGTGICIDVCPKNCYMMNKKERKVELINSADCVRCGACIVQCPHDALSFLTPKGNIISPDFVRTYKLNLSGKRTQNK